MKIFTYRQSFESPLRNGGLGLCDCVLSHCRIIFEGLYDQEPVINPLPAQLGVAAQERELNEHRYDRHQHQQPEDLTAFVLPGSQ